MGLGPPVCEKCRVGGKLVKERTASNTYWICPICGNEKLKMSLFTCGMTEEELADNERFLRFATGKQDAT